MSEPIHDTDLAALKEALSRLSPVADRIDIGQLLYRAGQASVRRRPWVWPSATAASLLMTTCLAVVLVLRPAPHPVERVVTVYVERPASPTEPVITSESPARAEAPPVRETVRRQPGERDYLSLRRDVLAHGLDALPPPVPWPAATQPRNPDTLLDLPPGADQGPWLRPLLNSLRSGDAS